MRIHSAAVAIQDLSPAMKETRKILHSNDSSSKIQHRLSEVKQ